MSGRAWSEEELSTVEKLYPVAKWPDLLKALPGRSQASIRCQVIAYGIKRQRNSRTAWTGAERKALRELWPNAPWAEILEAIPRHPQGAIAKQAGQLKLRRDCAMRHSKFRIIRELREKRRGMGIEARHLANRIGVHPVQLAKWERGEHMPKLRSFFDWCEALGFTLMLSR